jgi:hypothetical protein
LEKKRERERERERENCEERMRYHQSMEVTED